MIKRKILFFIGSRANYSSIKSVMLAVKKHPLLEIQIICGTSSVLEKFGDVSRLIENDGFKIDKKLFNLIEGGTLEVMAKSTGLAMIDASNILQEMKPNIVVIVGDRFEMMSFVIAAAYMNIPIAHTMGGEISGTIDENIRHAITKLSQFHFVASTQAENIVIKLGENPNTVFNYGCPRIDLVKADLEQNDSLTFLEANKQSLFRGVGNLPDFKKDFILVSQHPVTTEYDKNKDNFSHTLYALNELKIPTILLWPNADAGSDDISKVIRKFRENNDAPWMFVSKNLSVQTYIHLLNTTKCLVGNSSSGIREAEFIGTPVVNIGSRQRNRERGKNVLDCEPEARSISNAIKQQLNATKYDTFDIYGTGKAGERIAEKLATLDLQVEKTLNYLEK